MRWVALALLALHLGACSTVQYVPYEEPAVDCPSQDEEPDELEDPDDYVEAV